MKDRLEHLFRRLHQILKQRSIVSGVSIFLLFVFLGIPSHQNNWFDGLPWSTSVELLAAGVLIPYLLLLNRDFLSQKRALFLLSALLVIKLILLGTLPANGLKLWAYSSEEDMQVDSWERTYSTLIYPEVSQVLVRDLTDKLEFPIEWSNDKAYDPPDIWLGIRFSGSAEIPRGSQLGFIAAGLRRGDVEMMDVEGVAQALPIFKDAGEVSYDATAEAVSSGRIEGELIYLPTHKKWSLIPVLVFPDGHYEQAHEQNVFWQTDSSARLPLIWLGLSSMLGSVVDWGMLLFLTIWWYVGIRPLLPEARWPLVIGVIIPVIAIILRDRYFDFSLILAERYFGGVGVNFIERNFFAGWIILSGALLIAWRLWTRGQPGYRSLSAWKIILIAIAPLVLGYFLGLLWDRSDQVEFLSQGNDWLTYQVFARQIFLNDDSLHTARAVLRFQPLYRYMVGFLHTFFGHSTASLYFLNVWSLLGTAMALSWIAEQWGVLISGPLTAGLVVIGIESATSFRIFLVRALQEHPASLFILLTAWSVSAYRRRKKSSYLFLASIFGMVGVLTRIDHLFMIAAVSLFMLGPLHGGLREVWEKAIKGVFRHLKAFTIYFGAIAMALCAVALRNWFIGGQFVISESQAIHSQYYLTGDPINRLYGVIRILSADSLRSLSLYEVSSLLPAAVFLWGGTIASAVALVWRGGVFRKFNLSLGIVCLGGLLPYFFYQPMGYFPRWSIHLLPFTVLAVIVLVDQYLKLRRAKEQEQESPSF